MSSRPATSLTTTLDAVARARAEGAELVLPDAGWPAPVRAAAGEAVAAARAVGRLGPGTIVTFSSGSTGHPKGIVRTHASWETSMPAFTQVTGIGADDVVWLPGSLGASLYSFGAWHATAVGARASLDPDGATAVHCVPTTLRAILAQRACGQHERLQVALVAGEPLSEQARARATDLGIRVVEYYGAAELSLVAVRGSQGLAPFPGVECAVRDGVLWSRSPYAMTCYLDGTGTSDDRWRTVGDLVRGRTDAFEVLGRGDLAVSVGGHTVVVEEVERALRALPGVTAAAAVGLPHARLGEQLGVVVEGPTGVDAVRAAVAGWPRPSRPRRILVADLPRLPGGKPDRAAVREMLAR